MEHSTDSPSFMPTLSFQLPFILLGNSLVPTEVYNPDAPQAFNDAKLADMTRYLLSKQYPGIKVQTWVSRPEPQKPEPHEQIGIATTSNDQMEAEELEEKRLAWQKEESERWERMLCSGEWLCRKATKESKDDVVGMELGTWKEGDGFLTPEEEKLLPRDCWSFAFVLQRFGVDVDRRDVVLKELGLILETLVATCNRAENEFFKIVLNERCRIRIGCMPGGSQEGWGTDMISKMLTAVAGWERELTAIDTLGGVLEYSYLSRFLELRGIRELRRDRKHSWKRLPKAERTVASWNREKETFEYEIKTEERTAPEDLDQDIWREIDEMVRKEAKLEALVKDLDNFETLLGRRLAVSLPLTSSEDDDESDNPIEGQDSSIAPMAPSNAAKQPLDISCFVFQSHRSTLDIRELTAYIDLLSSLLDFLTSNTYEEVRSRIESFRLMAALQNDPPRQSVVHLLHFLGTSKMTRDFYKARLPLKDEIWTTESESPQKEFERAMLRAEKPFDEIVKAVEERRRIEREYVPIFLNRYEEAGGFCRLRRTKLLALVEAEEEGRHERTNAKEKISRHLAT